MARYKKGDLVSLTVEDLAFGGEGVGRLDGYVIFVRGGVPGDRLAVRLVQTRRAFARGAIEAVEEPSPHRTVPLCPHFGPCGGCRLQQIRYESQLAFKEKQVRDSLERIGKLSADAIRPIMGAEEIWGYRNKMEFTIAEDKGQAVMGLHEAERFDRILDISRCHICPEAFSDILKTVRGFIRERGLSIYDLRRNEGLLRYLMLREGRATGETMVNVVTSSPDFPLAAELARLIQSRHPQVSSVVLNVNPKKANVATGEEEHLLAGRETIRERAGGLEFQISPNSFFQTNSCQAEHLFATVLEYAALAGHETVFDLYAGTGAITLMLARKAREVYGIEVGQPAIDDAARNARANGIRNVVFLRGEVRLALPELMRRGIRAQMVVADPPRAGFHPKALKALVEMGPQRIVYVSCNPSTLARDLEGLAGGGYQLRVVQPMDMFPHTPHIEAVASLDRG